jgi:hypothetical protein
MKVKRIIWLPEFEDKLLWKHNVLAIEVEEILFGKPRIYFVEHGHAPNEDLYAAHGRTEEGRYLIVFYVYKEDGAALIISARDMDHKEKKRYGRK